MRAELRHHPQRPRREPSEPSSFWDHLTGEQTAALHRCFLETYDRDVAKVVNDYRYPIPAGVQTLEDPASLRAFTPLGLDEPCFDRKIRFRDRRRKCTRIDAS